MDQKNLAQSLGAFQKKSLFRPFIVEFVNGEEITVEHPEAVRYQGRGTAVYWDRNGRITLFDHDSVATLSDVAEVASQN